MALLSFSCIGEVCSPKMTLRPCAKGVRKTCSLVVLAVFLVIGCSQSSSNMPKPNDFSLLRGVVSTYRVANSSLGHPPQNIDELKSVLAPLLKDPSEVLRSKRDGEDFVIIWGLDLNSAPGDLVVAYERTGVDGKRMVVTADANVTEVSATEFANLKFPNGHQPAS